MGFIKDTLMGGVEFYKSEIAPVLDAASDLNKAEKDFSRGTAQAVRGQEPKAMFYDPMDYGGMAYGYRERFANMSFEKLRQTANASSIIQAILQTRINQVAAFARPQPSRYEVGFKIGLRDQDKKPTAAEQKRANEIEQFIVNCGIPLSDPADRLRRDSFDQFLRKFVRDRLTIDQACFEIVPRNNGKPFEFLAIDSATIRLVAPKMVREERNPFLGALQQVDSDHTERKPSKNPAYAQVVRGRIVQTYDREEMCMAVANPRTDILAYGYGFSELEMLVTTVAAHMNAELYNRKFFSQGAAIKGILSFEGNIPETQLSAFRRQWHAQVSGVQNAWRTPIVNTPEGKLNFVPMHAGNREMEFEKWMTYLIRMSCSIFLIDPEEIGFQTARMGGGGSAASFESGNSQKLVESRDKGLKPLLHFISSALNEYIVYRLDPDFCFEFVGLNAKTIDQAADLHTKEATTYKTVNEVRAELDLPPLKKLPESPGDIIMNSTYLQFMQQIQQAEQAAQGMGPDGQPMPGGPGGAPGGMGGDQGDQEGQGDEPEPDYSQMSDDQLLDHYRQLKQKHASEGGDGEPEEDNPEESAKAVGLSKSVTLEL